MAIEALKSSESSEIDNVLSWFKEELKNLKYLIWWSINMRSKSEKPKEKLDEKPEPIKLKNGYEVRNYWSKLVFDVKNDAYTLTVRVRNWKMVFSNAEGEYWDWEFDGIQADLRERWRTITTTDDERINKINLYLANFDLDLISDGDDRNTVTNLLDKLPNNIVVENN